MNRAPFTTSTHRATVLAALVAEIEAAAGADPGPRSQPVSVDWERLRLVAERWPTLLPLERDGIASQLSRHAEVLLAVVIDLLRPPTPAEQLLAELTDAACPATTAEFARRTA